MAAPTQELPEWYTIATTTLTNAAGAPTGTTTTLLYLPLTYYGPWIPLGPEWTYGGLTSPGPTPPQPSSVVSSTVVSESSSIPTASSSSAIPSTSDSITPSATPSDSISASSPSSESVSPSASAPTSSSTPEPSTPVSNLTTRNRNIAIIVGTVLGFLFLISVACLAFCWLTRFRSRSRASERRARLSDESFAFFPSTNTIDDAMRREREVQEQREMGEGSPRHSGEEVDPFLQPHSHYASHPEMAQARTGLVPVPGVIRDSLSSHPRTVNTMTTSTTGSGYGNIIPSPYTTDPDTLNAMFTNQQRGHILSPEEIRRISDESLHQPHPSAEIGTAHSLPIPPSIRMLPPSRSQTEDDEDASPLLPPLPPASYRPSTAFSSHTTLDQEQAELLTAQRFSVQRSPPPALHELPPTAAPTSWRDKIPFLKNMGSTSSIGAGSRPGSGLFSLVPDSLGSYQPLDSEKSNSVNRRSVLANVDRPISGVSGASGGTVYYDAKSSLGTSGRATPISTSEFGRMSPMPRAMTGGSGRNSPIPPVPPIPSGLRTRYDADSEDDVLDAPVPSALPFRSRAKTENSFAVPKLPFLPSGIKFGVLGHRPNLSFDVLEDEPPRAVQPWQAMSASSSRAGPVTDNRRATFGHTMPTVVNASPQASSYGSRSTGSAPSAYLSVNAQSRRNLHGSNSSRGTQSSLAHSGSVSSQGWRRGQLVSSTAGSRGPTSPALSAFGPGISPAPTPPPPSHPREYRSDTEMVDGAYMPGSSTTDSDTYAHGTTTSTGLSTLSSQLEEEFPDLPWAGGLDKDWRPISPPTRL